MKKKIIWIFTIVLSVTLIGLIVLQAYWIRNAITINEKQFNQLVNKSMANIVEEVEKREMLYHVTNEVEPFKKSTTAGDESINYKISNVSKGKYTLSLKDTEKEILLMDDSSSQNFLSRIHSFNISGMALNDLNKLFPDDFEEEDFFKPSYNTDRISTKLASRRIFVENIVNKLIQVDVDFHERIDQATLEDIISSEFEDNGIDLPYEYLVLNRGVDTIYASGAFSGNTNSRLFRGLLFPNDVVPKGNYLNIYFPDENSYIFKSSGYMIYSSILLTIVLIVGFSFSIHIIFKQKRLSQVKNDFVNNMTHELKTPISTISLASQMLKDDSIPDKMSKLGYISNIIQDESKRLSFQVEKVLKTALYEDGKIKLKPKKLNVHEIIDSVINNFELQVKQRDGILTKKLNAQEPSAVVDEVHFTNIIFNLLDNAVKYSKEIPEITISTVNYNESITISVEDKGVGIKKQDQKKIFDQFYRVPTGNIHDVKGFGLGLNYVKKVVEEHGGSVELESEFKMGSNFKLNIPLNYKYNG